MIKDNIFEYINNQYPELNELVIKYGEDKLDFKKKYEKLLAYLIFTNTLDSQRRMITLFHKTEDSVYKYIPFLILLGLYKKEILKIIKPTEDLNSKLSVLYKGGILEFDRLNYKDKTIEFSGGIHSETIYFQDFCFCKPYHEKHRAEYNRVSDIIEPYIMNDIDNAGELFKLSTYKKFNPESGIILFTSKGKFEELLRKLKINDCDISNYINIKKAVYKKATNDYSYKCISKIKDTPVSLLIAEYNDIHSIEEFQSNYKNLDTVVLDDFDKRYYKNNDEMIERLQHMNKCIDEKTLRDVYMIFPDSDLKIINEFNFGNIQSYYWISADLDKLDDIGYKNVKYMDLKKNDYDVMELELRKVISGINILLNKSQSQDYLFSLIKSLFIIKRRFFSYYDIDSFGLELKEIKNNFIQYSQEYLYQDNYVTVNQCINEFFDNVEICLDNNKLNSALKLNIDCKDLNAFISINDNDDDNRYLINSFKNKGITIEKYNINNKYENVIIFGLDKSSKYFLDYHKAGNQLYFVLTKNELSFFLSNIKYASDHISIITQNNYRKELLNLENNNYFVDDNYKGLLSSEELFNNINLNKAKTKDYSNSKMQQSRGNTPQDENENSEDRIDIDDKLQELIDKIIDTYAGCGHNKIDITSRDMIKIIFEDGTLIKKGKNSKLYRLVEEDIQEISEMEVKASEINRYDVLIVFEGHDEKESLDELINNKICSLTKLKSIYTKSEKWREILIELSKRMGISDIRDLLVTRGFNITYTTIGQVWLKYRTTVPDNFGNLIRVLNEITGNRIHNPREVIESANKIRSIKTNIIRLLKLRSIEKTIGIETIIEDSELNELFEEIYKYCDIKTVYKIIRYDHDGNPI